jgi:hypothetical protein
VYRVKKLKKQPRSTRAVEPLVGRWMTEWMDGLEIYFFVPIIDNAREQKGPKFELILYTLSEIHSCMDSLLKQSGYYIVACIAVAMQRS